MFLILMTTSASHSRWLERHCPLSTVANPYTSVYLRKKSILMIESDEQHTYLSTTNENDGLTCDISHGECRSHLLKRNQKKGKKKEKKHKAQERFKKRESPYHPPCPISSPTSHQYHVPYLRHQKQKNNHATHDQIWSTGRQPRCLQAPRQRK